MSLRDLPYLPLYVQDYLTDEKLIECSASTTGIYSRLLCVMHKSDPYGTILLKQKDKQTSKQVKNFALKIAKQMPYEIEEIEAGLNELIDEKVLILNGDSLYQKRMVRDNEISLIRSEAGRKGGKKTQSFVKAKIKANTEDEDEDNNINKKKKERKNKSSISKVKIKETQNEIFGENWIKIKSTFEEFRKMRNKIRKPMTEYAEMKIIKKLGELSGKNTGLAIIILEQSIVKSWQDVFELKNNKGGKIIAEQNPRTYG